MLDKIASSLFGSGGGGNSGGSSAFDFLPNPLKWAQDQFNLGQARDEARTIRAEDIMLQKQFRDDANLRNSLSYKVNEAKSLGLSPWAVLGGASSGGGMGYANVGNPQGPVMEAHPGPSATEVKLNRLNTELLQQQVEGARLDNVGKAIEIEKARNPPGLPVAGKTTTHGQVLMDGQLPKGIKSVSPAHQTPGSTPGVSFETTPSGFAPTPSKDVKDLIEDSMYELRHFWRYGILPNFGYGDPPPNSMLPPGADSWRFNPLFQEYQGHSKRHELMSRKQLVGLGPLPQFLVDLKNKFKKKYRIRRVKNENPFYGGYTTEGYWED